MDDTVNIKDLIVNGKLMAKYHFQDDEWKHTLWLNNQSKLSDDLLAELIGEIENRIFTQIAFLNL